jgi:hypothetical protein
MKINLRDLFWVVLVAGVCCAWWIDHRDLSRYRRAIVKLKTLGFDVSENGFLKP